MSLPSRRFNPIVCLLILLGLLAPAALFAQDVEPQDMLMMAKRAAELDAYRLLAERIPGLAIISQTEVRDFVTEDDRIAVALDHFIKGVRLGQPEQQHRVPCGPALAS